MLKTPSVITTRTSELHYNSPPHSLPPSYGENRAIQGGVLYKEVPTPMDSFEKSPPLRRRVSSALFQRYKLSTFFADDCEGTNVAVEV